MKKIMKREEARVKKREKSREERVVKSIDLNPQLRVMQEYLSTRALVHRSVFIFRQGIQQIPLLLR